MKSGLQSKNEKLGPRAHYKPQRATKDKSVLGVKNKNSPPKHCWYCQFMTCSKALGALGLISVRGLDHPLTGHAFLSNKVNTTLQQYCPLVRAFHLTVKGQSTADNFPSVLRFLFYKVLWRRPNWSTSWRTGGTASSGCRRRGNRRPLPLSLMKTCKILNRFRGGPQVR